MTFLAERMKLISLITAMSVLEAEHSWGVE
jgi:hypothetical protein